MKNRTYPKAVLSAAIVVGWMWLTAAQCGDVAGPTPTVQGCSVTPDLWFPQSGTLFLDKPATCPLKLTGLTQVPYAAAADLPAGSVLYGFFQTLMYDRVGNARSAFATAMWSQGNTNAGARYFANITGDYYAAEGGFANSAGHDDIYNGFSVPQGWSYSIARITYQFGFPSNQVGAPSAVDPYAMYTVRATTNDPMLVNPLTWQWYVDGTFYGTTSSPEMTVQAGSPNAFQTIQAIASDPYGRSISGQTTVWIGSGCYVDGMPVDQC